MFPTLQHRFLVSIILAGLIPFTIIGLLLFRALNNEIRTQAMAELTRLSEGAADELNTFVLSSLTEARAIAALPDVKSMETARLASTLTALKAELPRYAQFGIAEPDSGELLFTIPPITATSISHVPSYLDARTGRQSTLIFPALTSPRLILHIHTPVTNTNNQVIGVLGSPVPLPNLQQILQKRCIDSGNALLIDQSGQVVVQAKPVDLTKVNYPALLDLPDSLPSSLDLNATYEISNTRMLASMVFVPNYNWWVVVERPEGEVLAPLYRALWLGSVGLLLSALLLMSTAWWLARNLLRPIRSLATVAQGLGEGNSALQLPEYTDKDEIGTLIQAFDRMRNAVTEREASIRKQVSAIEASSEGIAMLDGQLTYTYVNRAYLGLYKCVNKEEMVGSSCSKYQPVGQAERLLPLIKESIQRHNAWHSEILGLNKLGKTFEQEVSLTKLESGDYVCVARDITQRKETERALQQTQRLESLGVLAGGIAHDFNNLLTAISSSAGLAQERLAPDALAQKQLELILKSTKRASNLTQQLLAYAGKRQATLGPVAMNQLVEDSLDLLQTIVPQHAQIETQKTEALPTTTADEGQIQQIFMNLVLNAAEALDTSGGTVTISTELEQVTVDEQSRHGFVGGMKPEPGRYVCLEVCDNGKGMSAQTRDQIFDPFFTTKSYGRGLGLSATLGILRAHKGALSVESAVGLGSTFRVYLPADDDRPDPIQDVSIAQVLAPISADSLGSVLLVEDEVDVADAVSEILESAGLPVLLAQNGAEGVEQFRRHQRQIAVVMLDMKMPVMDGEAAYLKIREIDSSVPVIFSSGYSEQDTLNRIKNHEHVFFMQKPYTLKLLIQRVKELAEKNRFNENRGG